MSSTASGWRSYAAAAGPMLLVALVVVYVLLLRARLFPAGGVRLSDFQCFWSAAKVALTEAPAKVYDIGAFGDAQRALLGYTGGLACKFIYTPVSLLLFLPLALLPYTASAVAWLAATATAYALALRALLPGWPAVLPFLALPAVFVNACYVQNGFLSAALLAAATGLLATRPILAGVCLGCFAYKPQLGLVTPLALAAAGRWRAFMAAAATVLGLAAAASAAFGAEIWAVFLTGVVGDAGGWLDGTTRRNGADMPSVFAAVRMLVGGHAGWAYAAQAAAAAGACALMVTAIRRGPGARAEGALAAAAIPLATPYLFIYDQVILAVPLAWMLAEARRTGFLRWERAAFWALLVSPALAYAATLAWGWPLGPLVSAGVFAAVLRRVHRLSAGGAPVRGRPREALA